MPVEGEKLRQLRKDDEDGKTVLWWRWGRAFLLIVVVILLVSLAIGLGVGLAHHHIGRNSIAKSADNQTEATLEFPLGRWTVKATLVEANTGCTSNPAIWRCYPYTLGGATTFDLTILNTSALYAPNNTVNTAQGPARSPANLTVSSSNPFAIPFINQSLTYVAPSWNATAARLEWSFTMTKSVVPSSPAMPDGETVECSFAGATFTGSLHLRAPAKRPEAKDESNEWPYAVEVRQRWLGSGGAVDCKGLRGGKVSVPSVDGRCGCAYRNY